MSAALGYRPEIDGLRAVSVTVVMLFHLDVSSMGGGFVGVDVFFVISGFLITSIIAREIDDGTFTFAGFYERRIRRIYPALIVVLVATLAAAWVMVMPRGYVAFARTLVAAPLFASNFMFLGGDGYFDPASITKPLLHTWSLGVEEQFYILFPWLLMAVARFCPRRRVAVVGAVVALSYVGSVVAGVLDWKEGYFLLPTRFFELGVGALLALARPRLSAPWRAGLGTVGLAAVLGTCALLDEAAAFPGWVALVPCLGAAGVILADTGPAARLLALPPMVFVGRISYPMYLWHWPVIVFAAQITGGPIGGWLAVGLFALTVALSWATFVLVETPIRSRRLLGPPNRLFLAAAAASAVLVAFGIHGVVSRGWPTRLPADVLALVGVSVETTTLEKVCPHRRRDMGRDLPPCFVGAPDRDRVDFAILGDSHGRGLAGEIGEVAKRAGLRGIYLGRVACQPLLGIERIGDATRRCAEHLDWALGRIRDLDPPVVVMIGRWGGLAGEASDAASRADPVVWRAGGRIVPAAEATAAIGAGFAATLDALAGRRVVVLAAVPEPGYDVPTLEATARRFHRPPPAPPRRADHDARQVVAKAWMAQAVAGRANVEIVDPAETLCDAAICRTMADGVPLYVDDNHPSPKGAAVIAEGLLPALARAKR